MTRRHVWIGCAIVVAAAVWFVGASYAFLFMVGLHHKIASGESVTGFYNAVSDGGFYPSMAYWTYWGGASLSAVDYQIYKAAFWAPDGVGAIIALFGYRSVVVWNRMRRRFPTWSFLNREDDSPRPLERGLSDNHGHGRLATKAEIIAEFPRSSRQHGAKVVGMIGKRMLFDDARNRSGLSLEIAGTRSGKTTGLVSSISHWTGPQVVLDPKREIGPMMWRHLTAQGRRVYILNPDPSPEDAFGNPAPWAHLLSRYNPIDWIDINHWNASSQVSSVARYFIDDDGTKADATAMFFRNAARSLISCILAHILWSDGEYAAPKTLAAMRAIISLEDAKLRQYLISVHANSPSFMARNLAGPLVENSDAEKQFKGIREEANQATSWLADPALSDMVSEGDFRTEMITGREPVTIFLQLPMDTLLTHKCLARVLFGSLVSAKIASGTKTKTLFIPDECWLLGRMNALQIALFAGSGHGIVMHMPWQSMGQIEEIWGQSGRKSWFDNAAYICVSGIRDPIVAKEISDMCGTMPVIAFSEGDNRGTQGGIGIGKISMGRNVNRHEIKRSVMMLSEVIADIPRGRMLVLGLRHPALIDRAIWKNIPELRDEIEDSPYQEEEDEDMAA